jgi:hypothetical protein
VGVVLMGQRIVRDCSKSKVGLEFVGRNFRVDMNWDSGLRRKTDVVGLQRYIRSNCPVDLRPQVVFGVPYLMVYRR